LDTLLISALILLVGLGLLAFFSKRYADFWFNVLVSDKAAVVNEVLSSEELPSGWRLPLLERVAKGGQLGQFSPHLESLLKRWYLYRLDRLIRSFQNVSFVNKNLKNEYLAGLVEIRADWQERQDLF
jgi:hypothetical protein